MIAPSPDWFIGVSGLPLQDASDWRHYRVVSLHPYNSGHRGWRRVLPKQPAQKPLELIRQIDGSPFIERPTIRRLHVIRLSESGGPSEPCGDISLDLSVGLSDIVLLRRYLSDPGGEPLFDGDPTRCTTIEPASTCNAADLAALTRGVAGLEPGIAPVCATAGL